MCPRVPSCFLISVESLKDAPQPPCTNMYNLIRRPRDLELLLNIAPNSCAPCLFNCSKQRVSRTQDSTARPPPHQRLFLRICRLPPDLRSQSDLCHALFIDGPLVDPPDAPPAFRQRHHRTLA
mmetsp:Transcript_50563/g.134546  ORF Transcript_50563/g.134546 Transcript_50563/m.134546 type:complete len:123 (+) Transcript_50563:12-380(+)